MSVEMAICRRYGRVAEIVCFTAVIVLFAAAAKAQTPQPMPPGPPPDPARPPLTPVDQADENFTFLKDPSKRTDFWDFLKYIPLNQQGDDYLTLGFEHSFEL